MSYCVYVDKDSKQYSELAQVVTESDTLSCPRCGEEMMLCLDRDKDRRGMWFTASFLCPKCNEKLLKKECNKQ